MNEVREQCGVFGVYSFEKTGVSLHEMMIGMYGIQHRGQEGSGLAYWDSLKKEYSIIKTLGLVANLFSDKWFNAPAKSSIMIGHVRYSTAGRRDSKLEVQPFVYRSKHNNFAIAHNGNLVNVKSLEEKFGVANKDEPSSDSYWMGRIIMDSLQRYANNQESLLLALQSIFRLIKGAYSILFADEFRLIGLRDEYGFRPLSFGSKNGSFAMSSETCSLEQNGYENIREVPAGGIVWIENNKCQIIFSNSKNKKRNGFCSFEWIYFSRPDSSFGGWNVYQFRKEIGKKMGRLFPKQADCVIPVPESSLPISLGYAEETGLKHEAGIFRNFYVGRTFIEPIAELRDVQLKIKLNPNKSFLKGKQIVLVDDSIVRGTTILNIVHMLKECEVSKIHLIIGSPQIMGPCYYGMDFPKKEKLMSFQFYNDVAKIRKHLDVDSLHFFPLQSLRSMASQGCCDACFSGEYLLNCSGISTAS